MDPADILHDNNALGKNRNKEKQYAFDFALDKDTSQMEIFQKTTKFLCDGILNGYNATVFTYGATGAGKTYT
jgi:kinesin family protein 18/19